jgi:hypothetical protein
MYCTPKAMNLAPTATTAAQTALSVLSAVENGRD